MAVLRLPPLTWLTQPPVWAIVVMLLLGVALLTLLWHLHKMRARVRVAAASAAGRDGLLTREQIESELDDLVRRCDRSGEQLSLLCISLNNADLVNDAYGHEQTDRLVGEATRRLRQLCGQHTMLGRLGGVDLLLLLPAKLDDACALADRMCRCLALPYSLPGHGAAEMSCSIGLAVYPLHGDRAQLVQHAALAMRQVRHGGGADFTVFDPQVALSQRERAELLADLRHAVDRGELQLVYQPKIDARTLQITAAEALLRWHHPKRGMISPAVFIPLAERHGLIAAIGDWVIEEASRQAGQWRAIGLRMRVAINISAYQMRQQDLVDRLLAALSRHQLQPSRFTCEITESVAMEDTAVTQRSFERMRSAGLHVSIDDFGVGQASLSYLRRLPAAELKIDASFVQDLATSSDARAIVEAVVRLAHALGLRVVAEGVETERQRDLLVALDCDELQGYLFAKPMPAKLLTAWAQMGEDRLYHQQKAGFRESLFHETLPAPI